MEPPRCRIGAVVHRGPIIEIGQPVEPAAIVDAIEREDTPSKASLAVSNSSPPPVYDHIGWIHGEMGLRTKTALAKAGRSRGMTTPVDEALEATRERLQTLEVPDEYDPSSRKEAAELETETARLREEVAAARGRLQTLKEHDLDPGPAADALEEAIRRLSEAETDRAAAKQSLTRMRTETRDRRNIRERQFELSDRKANLEREARAHLVDALRDEFVETVAEIPGKTVPTEPFECDPVPAALAIAKIATCSTPLVLSVNPFDSLTTAYGWLESPIIHV